MTKATMEAAACLRAVVANDLNWEVWSTIMKTTLTKKGLWEIVENGIPPDPTKIPEVAANLKVEQLRQWREVAKKDMEALQFLQTCLTDSVFKKTLSASSANELWKMLEPVPEHQSLAIYDGGLTYNENMWMVFTTTTNHMTPYENLFTTLDRTRTARVTFNDGSTRMAEGTGDVTVLTKGGEKMTIKDVLFVPGIVANVISVGQMCRSGFDVEMNTQSVAIRDQKTRKLFAKTKWEQRGFVLRLQVR